ncbi:hypothetical protein FBY28_1682 [Arthrobacter sp. SLBN-53]|nr:hypothetical protein FBY28_1682 [Arthrobacter sp. SLBN-53]
MSGPQRAPRDVVNVVFGEELPSTTRDERDSDQREDYTDRDRWLRDNVPPHHG